MELFVGNWKGKIQLLYYHMLKWKSEIERIRLEMEQKKKQASYFYFCDKRDMSYLI